MSYTRTEIAKLHLEIVVKYTSKYPDGLINVFLKDG